MSSNKEKMTYTETNAYAPPTPAIAARYPATASREDIARIREQEVSLLAQGFTPDEIQYPSLIKDIHNQDAGMSGGATIVAVSGERPQVHMKEPLFARMKGALARNNDVGVITVQQETGNTHPFPADFSAAEVAKIEPQVNGFLGQGIDPHHISYHALLDHANAAEAGNRTPPAYVVAASGPRLLPPAK